MVTPLGLTVVLVCIHPNTRLDALGAPTIDPALALRFKLVLAATVRLAA